MPYPQDTLSLPQGKADQVSRLLLEISRSEKITCIAKAVQLADFADQVRRHAKDPEIDDVWDSSLAFLQDLSQGLRHLARRN